jgi:ketosteroid isomerase-like protein
MPSDTAALLQAIYNAYRENRLADVLASFSDDFRFILHLPEDVVSGGDKPRNKAETAELLETFLNTYDILAYDPGPIIVTGDRATVQPQIRYRDKRTGKVLETRLAHAWRVDGGKATQLDERHDVAKIQAFLKSVAEDDM